MLVMLVEVLSDKDFPNSPERKPLGITVIVAVCLILIALVLVCL